MTINLPQAAYRARRDSDRGQERYNRDQLYKEIEKALGQAMKAHLEKKKFIGELMRSPAMPMWEVGKIARDGTPYIDLDKATYIIGMIGLNECVQSFL